MQRGRKKKSSKNCKGCKASDGRGCCGLGFATVQSLASWHPSSDKCPKPTTSKALEKEKGKIL